MLDRLNWIAGLSPEPQGERDQDKDVRRHDQRMQKPADERSAIAERVVRCSRENTE